jgi:hypothetical protein
MDVSPGLRSRGLFRVAPRQGEISFCFPLVSWLSRRASQAFFPAWEL